MARRIESVATVMMLIAAAPAFAAERHDVNVPAGRLGDAVIALGQQTGTSIGMSDQTLAATPVRTVKGRLSAERALARLLDGGPARAVRIDGASWRIVRAVRHAPPPPAPRVAPPTPVAEEQPADEIVVTASKRDTPLTRYAGTVEIVRGDYLPSGDASSGTGALLARVASLSSTHVGPGRNKLFVRAIADSGFAGPTQATTGQYLGDMRLNYASPDPDLRLYDVAGIEILEGPQGTLYGAGSLGGIIRIVPNAPNPGVLGGHMSTGLTMTQHGAISADTSATLNLPIVADTLALRVVGYASSEGGYIDDSLRGLSNVNRTRIGGGRAALRYTPNAEWTIDLNGVYQHTQGDDAQYATNGAGALTRRSPVAQPYMADYALGNVRVERRWGDMAFVSTAGYVHHVLHESYDASPSPTQPILFEQRNRTEIFSTETRLTRDLHDGYGWLIGGSYLDSQSHIRRTIGPIGMPLPAAGVQNKLQEWTLFGEASVQPIESLILTAGGRFTNTRLGGEALDPVMIAFPKADLARAEAQADRKETIFLPSLGLISTAIPDVSLFLRFQQGFRPGGLAVDDYRAARYRNDRISTIEAGVRHGMPGYDPVALSLGFTYADWRDIQADFTDRRGLPSTANIGDGRIYTVEGRLALHPMRGLTVDISGIFNDSRLSRPALFVTALSATTIGQSLALPNVANLGGRFAVDYTRPLDDGSLLRFSGSARYVGRSRLGIGPILGREQGDYVDTSLSANWASGPLQFSLTLTNLADAEGNRFALGSPFTFSTGDYTPMRPRSLRFGVDFAF